MCPLQMDFMTSPPRQIQAVPLYEKQGACHRKSSADITLRRGIRECRAEWNLHRHVRTGRWCSVLIRRSHSMANEGNRDNPGRSQGSGTGGGRGGSQGSQRGGEGREGSEQKKGAGRG